MAGRQTHGEGSRPGEVPRSARGAGRQARLCFQHLCLPLRPLPYLTWPITCGSSTGPNDPTLPRLPPLPFVLFRSRAPRGPRPRLGDRLLAAGAEGLERAHLALGLVKHIYIYIYVYIYLSLSIYIYIYTHIHMCLIPLTFNHYMS